MIRTRTWALLLPLLLVACGGATVSEPESDPAGKTTVSDPPHAPATSPAPSAPSTELPPSAPKPAAAPFTTNPASTFAFKASQTYARRQSALVSPCGKNDAAFSDNDSFTLQAVGSSSSLSAQIKGVVVVFKGTAPIGVSSVLTVSEPTPYGQQAAQSSAASVTVFASDATDGPLTTPIDGATVTVLDVPKAEGAPLTARVVLHFASGEILDATISAPVETSEGPCAGGNDG